MAQSHRDRKSVGNGRKWKDAEGGSGDRVRVAGTLGVAW